MKILTVLFCIFTATYASADTGNGWGVNADAAESFIETLEQVVTVHADAQGQKNIPLKNIYCFVGSDGEGAAYDCAIKYGLSESVNFGGKLAEALYSKLKASDSSETMQVGGTSVEVKNINCETTLKSYGSANYLSSQCRGEKVSIRY